MMKSAIRLASDFSDFTVITLMKYETGHVCVL